MDLAVVLLMVPGTAVIMGVFAIAWTLLFAFAHTLAALFSRIPGTTESEESDVVPLPADAMLRTVAFPAVSS